MNWLAGSALFSCLCFTPPALAQVEQETYFKAATPTNFSRFGFSVARSGDTLVVGASGESSLGGALSGAIYVFRLNGTTWVEEAFVKAPAANVNDSFGATVDVDGDTIVVGAPNEDSSDPVINGDFDDDLLTNAGAAFVYVRTGTDWNLEAYLKPANVGLNHFFGTSVSIEGDEILVGCPGERGAVTGVNGDPNAAFTPRAGAAYLFERSGTDWAQTAYIKASNTGAEDNFGTAVAIDGDTILIGAPREDSNATGVGGDQNNANSLDSGAAYVFARTGTTWAQEAYLKSVGPQLFQTRFGTSVDLSGDTAIVGGFGKAEVFERTGTTWVHDIALASANPIIVPGNFGTSVSIDGDTAAVGAPTDSSGSSGINGSICDAALSLSGAVLLYRRVADVWSPTTYIKASVPGQNDEFGHSVDVFQDKLSVGAPNERSEGAGVNGSQQGTSESPRGAAFEFDLASSTVNPPEVACELFKSRCDGDGGDQMGCTDCPCGNNGSTEGGCLNSLGSSALLTASGGTALPNLTLRFEATGLPPSVTGLLISGQNLAPTNPMNPCVGLNSGVTAVQLDGLRCAVFLTRRHGARQSDANGDIGVTTPGWGDPDGFFNTNAFVIGQERHFQVFYRDDDTQVCMTGQNTTQAITTTFLP